MLLAQVVADYERVAATAIATLERGFDDATAVLALPQPYRKRQRTVNGEGRLNEEVRRRERVIRIFPNRPSSIRLLGALLMEQDKQWSTGKRYFDRSAYGRWHGARSAQSAPLEIPSELVSRYIPAGDYSLDAPAADKLRIDMLVCQLIISDRLTVSVNGASCCAAR